MSVSFFLLGENQEALGEIMVVFGEHKEVSGEIMVVFGEHKEVFW